MTDNDTTAPAQTMSLKEEAEMNIAKLTDLLGAEFISQIEEMTTYFGERCLTTHISGAIDEGRTPTGEDLQQGLGDSRALMWLISDPIRSLRNKEDDVEGSMAELARTFAQAAAEVVSVPKGAGEGLRMAWLVTSILASAIEMLTEPIDEPEENIAGRLVQIGQVLASCAVGLVLMDKDRDPETLSDAERSLNFLRYLHAEYELEEEGDVDACAVTEDLYNFMDKILGWKIG